MKTNLRHLFWRVRYDLGATWRRYGRAFRYAIGRASHEDAINLLWDAEALSHHYALCSISAESVLLDLLDQYEDNPALARYAEEATSRVAHQWNDSGDTAAAAIEWAIDLVRDYARADGVELVEIGESTCSEVKHAHAAEG